MDKVFVFQEPSPVKVCTFLHTPPCELVLYATDNRLVLFSISKAEIIHSLEHPKQQFPVQPVCLFQINQTQFMLQSRNGWMFIYSCKQSLLQLESFYRIQYMGFSRIGLLQNSSGFPNNYYYYDEEHLQLYRTDVVHKDSVSFTLDQDDKVSHISHMYARTGEDNTQIVYICIEGGRILEYEVVFRQNKDPICKLLQTYTIESKSQPAIILDCLYVLISNSPCLICTMRQSNIVVCNLNTKQLLIIADKSTQNFYRILHRSHDSIYASSNRRLVRLQPDKLSLSSVIQFGQHSLVNDFKVAGELAIVSTEDRQLLVIELNR